MSWIDVEMFAYYSHFRATFTVHRLQSGNFLEFHQTYMIFPYPYSCVIAASEDAPRLGIDFRKLHYATSTKPNPLRALARNGPTGQQNRCVAYRQIRLQRRKKSWFCPHDTSGIVESLNLRVETRLNHKGQGIILVSPLKSNGFCPRVKQEIYTKRKCPIPAVWETQVRQYSRG